MKIKIKSKKAKIDYDKGMSSTEEPMKMAPVKIKLKSEGGKKKKAKKQGRVTIIKTKGVKEPSVGDLKMIRKYERGETKKKVDVGMEKSRLMREKYLQKIIKGLK